MASIPAPAAALLAEFAPAFTQPTFERAGLLLLAALLTTGRRTVTNLLRTLGGLAHGHPASYRRVLSAAHWSGLRLAAALCRLLFVRLGPRACVGLVADDTVTEHKGKHVWGKGRHRDPVRSTKSYTAWRWGHKWVVLAVLVRFPFATRAWALPVLVALYRPKGQARRHRTPAQLAQLLVRLLRRWYPKRRFRLAVDGNYASHELARFAAGQGGRLALVSKFYPDAALYQPPPPYSGHGRPRVKGARLPSPQEVVAGGQRRRLTVRWYGGGWRRVEVVSGTGQWYQSGCGLVAVKWVFVHDRSGTHRDEYFFSTDLALTERQVIEAYTGRWNIETTFQEARAYLGVEATRGWCANTVRRAEPCLLGLYAVAALLYERLRAQGAAAGGVAWAGKRVTTFSDALTAVRRWLWADWVLAGTAHQAAFQKLPPALREVVLCALAPAA
jgi:DDE superfamily endonuclease